MAWDDPIVEFRSAFSAAFGNEVIRRLKEAVIGGTTGTTDNTLLCSDGTGGLTAKASPITVDADGLMHGKREPHYISIPAREWDVDIPKSMEAGATGAETIKETLSNGYVREYRGYGYTSAQYSFNTVILPEDYVPGTLYARAVWETESEDLSTLILSLNGILLEDGDSSDVALTVASATITDTSNGANIKNVSPWVTLAPSGTGTYLPLKLTRDYTSDTLIDDVKVLGIEIKMQRLLP